MSRKHRSLTGFDSVAGRPGPEVTNSKSNDKNNDDIDINSIINIKRSNKKFVGVYLDEDVAEALNRVAGRTKGAKSELVNHAIRKLLIDRGLM